MTARPLRPPTDDEIAAFHRDGAVLLAGVLPDDWVDVAAAGLDEAIAAPDAMSTDLGALRVDQFPAARIGPLRRLVDESPIAEIVGTVIGGAVRFYMDQLFHKPAGRIPPTDWHQDTSYYNIDGHDLIRAWVSPDAVPRELSLEVVRGSHRWNVTYRPLAGSDPSQDEAARALADRSRADAPVLGREAHEGWTYWSGLQDRSLPPVPDVAGHRDSFDILGWDFAPGDVLLFHGNILHSARGGHAPTQRRAHASLWAGPDVRYLHRPGQVIPDPVALYDHAPASGQPLSDFPDVFPVQWAPDGQDHGPPTTT